MTRRRRSRIEPVPDAPGADVVDLDELRREWGQLDALLEADSENLDALEAARQRHPAGADDTREGA